MSVDKDYLFKELFENPEASGVVLKYALDLILGDEWYFWDPSTIYLELRSEVRAEAATEVIDKIAAIQTVMVSGVFFEKLEAFLSVCNTLAEGVPSFTVFDPVTGPELSWAVSEVALMRDLIPFGPSIKIYTDKTMKHEGISTLPEAVNNIFGKVPETAVINDIVDRSVDPNTKAIDEYMNEHLRDIIAQFDRLEAIDVFHKLIAQQELNHVER